MLVTEVEVKEAWACLGCGIAVSKTGEGCEKAYKNSLCCSEQCCQMAMLEGDPRKAIDPDRVLNVYKSRHGFGVLGDNHDDLSEGFDTEEQARIADWNISKFKKTGLREKCLISCICRLLKKRCKYDCPRIPRVDHLRGFENRKTHERVLIHQPYIAVGKQRAAALEELRRESEAFAEKHGLTVRVSEDSWWYPGWTVLVEYRVKGNSALRQQPQKGKSC